MESTYAPVLFAHAWLRWIVLVLLALVVVRSIAGRGRGVWTAIDERLQVIAVSALDLQVMLGLWLYAVASPLSHAFLANPGATMKDPVIRFYGLEHITMMILGLAVVHVGRARSKRVAAGAARHRTVLTWTAIGLLLILAGVPWPFITAGRPLFRTGDATIQPIGGYSARSTTNGSTLVARRAGT
jgi:hypothetical protein